MARDFTLLMVGLVFALVDITLNRFELFPSFIGYALIAFAGHSLAQYAGKFRVMRDLALPLVALSLLGYVTPWRVSQILGLISSILTILLVWFLLAGVIQFTKLHERPDLAGHAVNSRRIYLGIAIMAFLIQLAAVFQPEEAAPFVTLMAVATIGILVFIVRVLYAVRHDLAVDVGRVV